MHDLSEEDELLAKHRKVLAKMTGNWPKNPKDQGLPGQSETNELQVQKLQGLSENDELLE